MLPTPPTQTPPFILRLSLLLALLSAALSPVCPALSLSPPPDSPSPQSDAIDEASRIDLPRFKHATRVTININDSPSQLSVSDPQTISDLLSEMIPLQYPPSAGKTLYTLTFFEGDALLGRVWVFDDGEWGISREGRTSWTLGFSPALAHRIQSLVKRK
jgi:hypothetical protein